MKSPILTALLHPLNILMMGVVVFAGLMSAWWLFPVGVVLWTIMVILVSRDRALRLNAQMQRRGPLAHRFQGYFDRIERAQVAIFNTLAPAPMRLRRAFQPILDEVNRLTEAVYALCRRVTSLENYRLVSQAQSNLNADLEHIIQVIEQTDDPALRQNYIESRRTLQERLVGLEGASRQLDRVEAQLMNLANKMDGIVAEVVRLQVAGQDIAEPAVSDIVRKLKEETEQLALSEQQAARL